MSECRWSGWPGAYCFDCGREDPREQMLATGEVHYDCHKEVCACKVADQWLSCPFFGPVYSKPFTLECAEPGSNRNNPYLTIEDKK
jgi:hypothetical protein